MWRGGRWAEGASPEAGEDFPAPVPHAGSAVPRVGEKPRRLIAIGRMMPCPVPRRPAGPEPVRAAVGPSRRPPAAAGAAAIGRRRPAPPVVPRRAGVAAIGLALLVAACSAHGPGQAGPPAGPGRPGPRRLVPGGSPGHGGRLRGRIAAGAVRGTAHPAGVPGPLPAAVRAGPRGRPPGRAGPAAGGRPHPALHLHRRGAPGSTRRRAAPSGWGASPSPRMTRPGATLGGRIYVFGGGEQSSMATSHSRSRRRTEPPRWPGGCPARARTWWR